jgi:phosphatidylinositol alpha-mannosyltransferase
VRVGIVCPYSLGVRGGVQAQVLGLARSLRSIGVSTQVLAPCDGLPPEPWVTPLGNSIPYAQNGSLAPLAPDPPAQLRTLGAVWDERFDLLHLHEPLAPGPTLTTLTVKPLPLIGTFHASGTIGAYRYLRPLVRKLTERLDHKVAVSEAAADMARRHLGGDYEVLFNGIEIERFAHIEPTPTCGPTVFFLARHEPRKGLGVLLQALDHLPSDVRLWVGGDGPQTESLREATADEPRVEWLGPISDAEKAARLRGADVFCVPSVGGESFGVVLLEGMAAGTPVVASDLSAYVETAGEDALYFPTGDARALAATLSTALERTARIDELVERGRERAASLSMRRLADAYLERYERLLS